MIAKDFLLQYRLAMMRIKNAEQDLAAIREERESIEVSLDGMPKGSNLSDKTAELAVKLADLEVQILKMRSRAWSIRMEIINTLDRLTDPAEVRLLHLRYIEGFTWEMIAVDMNYTYQWVAGPLHGQALQSLEKILTLDRN